MDAVRHELHRFKRNSMSNKSNELIFQNDIINQMAAPGCHF
jgi:hypothetical protein